VSNCIFFYAAALCALRVVAFAIFFPASLGPWPLGLEAGAAEKNAHKKTIHVRALLGLEYF
jgi:hypothetical protein